MVDKEPNFIISRTDLEAAQALANEGSEAVKRAEESGDFIQITRAELARTFFLSPEDRLRHSQEVKAMTLLVSGIVHDLNNLLGVITGRTGLAMARLSEDSPAFSLLQASQKAVLMAAGLTAQLAAFSKKQMLEAESVSTALYLEDLKQMLEEIKISIMPENINFSFHSDDNLGPITIDLAQFQRVFLNLFANASDAMPDGGELRVSVSNVDLSDADLNRFKHAKAGRHLRICVRDTGCGIPPEQIDQIFEPYFTTKGEHGTGLGLANVQEAVQQNGGDIIVDSKVGEGTTFTMVFPSCPSCQTT